MKSLVSLSSILLLTLLKSEFSRADDTVPVPYKLCGASALSSSTSNKAAITIDSVFANVWPPEAGQVFDVIATGSTSEDIQGGTYHVEVKLDELTILDKKGDLREAGITFPVKAGGQTVIHKSIKVPAQVPAGEVVVTGHAYDQDKNELLCIIVTADIGGGPESHNEKKSSSRDVKLGKIIIPNLSHEISQVEYQYKQQQQEQKQAFAEQYPNMDVNQPIEVIEIHISKSNNMNMNDGDIRSMTSSIQSLVHGIVDDMQHTIDNMRSSMFDWYGYASNTHEYQAQPQYIPGHYASIGIEVDTDMSHLPQKSYPHDITYDEDIYNGNAKDPVLHDLPYVLCGDENDPIQITSIQADNWPIVAGKPITIYVTGNVVKQIDDGTYEAKVLFDGLQVIDKKDTLEHLGVQLPLKVGENKFHKTFDVPKNLPQGDVQLSAVAHSNDGGELMCATIDIHL